LSENIKLIIAGDVFPTPVNYQLFAEGNIEQLFDQKILDIFKSGDYRICNLEGCFTGDNTKPKLKDGPNIRASKECVAAFSGLGVNCVSLANNHATDFGLDGLKDTFNVLSKAGIAFFGAGENEPAIVSYHTIKLKGKRITFYGVSETIENAPAQTLPGVNIYDEYRVCQELRLLKSKCDLLIVLYHGGIENIHFNTPSIRKRFHRMADNGADIIISQHTHAIGEEEFYNSSYFLYGQGNFCFHFSKKLYEWVETALLLEIDLNDNDYTIKRHLVRRDGPSVLYDDGQNLTGFYERSKRLSEGDTFKNELQKLADEKLLVYLEAFRGNNIIDKVARKLLSKEQYIEYLIRHYSQKHILKILLALQCEEFREVSSQGLLNMLAKLEERHGE